MRVVYNMQFNLVLNATLILMVIYLLVQHL